MLDFLLETLEMLVKEKQWAIVLRVLEYSRGTIPTEEYERFKNIATRGQAGQG